MRAILIATLCVILIPVSTLADNNNDNLQLKKEKELVETLKKLITCKNMGVYEDGDLYCTLSFRGLNLQFAGVNKRVEVVFTSHLLDQSKLLVCTVDTVF